MLNVTMKFKTVSINEIDYYREYLNKPIGDPNKCFLFKDEGIILIPDRRRRVRKPVFKPTIEIPDWGNFEL